MLSDHSKPTRVRVVVSGNVIGRPAGGLPLAVHDLEEIAPSRVPEAPVRGAEYSQGMDTSLISPTGGNKLRLTVLPARQRAEAEVPSRLARSHEPPVPVKQKSVIRVPGVAFFQFDRR